MTKLLNFALVKNITSGEWISPPENLEQTLIGGAFDTRALGEAEIFFAWKGENSDGHNYIQKLAGSGVKLAIVEKEVPDQPGLSILKVPNSLYALHQLAAYLAKNFTGKIINLTGSSGKTTTKTWLTHVLKERFKLLSNPGSFNNQIGCPITILSLQADHELMILEMGASELGDLELLSRIAPADIVLLLNVGHAHLGKFGSLENTYRAKTEIFSHTREGATLIVPGDDEKLAQYLPEGPFCTFGSSASDFTYRVVSTDGSSFKQSVRFRSVLGDRTVEVNQLGDYVGELLSAILAVCSHLGLGWEDVGKKLNSLPQEKGRSTFLECNGGARLLDDTYNANPESTVNMLKTICSLGMKRAVGVVGNLAELEEDLTESAAYIVDNIPDNLTDLILSGETGELLVPLIRERKPGLNTLFAGSLEEVIKLVRPMLDSDTVIGIKGSRSSHMERVVLALTDRSFSCLLEKCFRLNRCDICEQL